MFSFQDEKVNPQKPSPSPLTEKFAEQKRLRKAKDEHKKNVQPKRMNNCQRPANKQKAPFNKAKRAAGKLAASSTALENNNKVAFLNSKKIKIRKKRGFKQLFQNTKITN